MDEHRKMAEEIAFELVKTIVIKLNRDGEFWKIARSEIKNDITKALLSTASKSEKDGYRKGVEDSASCVVGIFPTARSAEILRSAIRRLIKEGK